MVAAVKKGRGSTSPSKVYAKRERTADFLLGTELVELDSESSQVVLELFGRLEYDPGHAKPLSCFGIGGHIVNIDGFLCTHFAGFEGFPVDKRVRLACAHAVGIDPLGKKTEEGVASLGVGPVERVGIGKQGEAGSFWGFFQGRNRLYL